MTVVQVYHEKIFSSALLEGLKTAVTLCQDRDDLNPESNLDNLNSKCDTLQYSSLELCSSLRVRSCGPVWCVMGNLSKMLCLLWILILCSAHHSLCSREVPVGMSPVALQYK